MPFLSAGGGWGWWWQFHLITHPSLSLSLVICCFPSVYSAFQPAPLQPQAGLFLLVISLSSIIFLPFVFTTVLHKPILLIASLVPSLLPLSVPAINRIACCTAVIGGPLSVWQYSVLCLRIFISNKWSNSALGVGLLCFCNEQEGAESCFAVLSVCFGVSWWSCWVRNRVIRFWSCEIIACLLSSLELESDLEFSLTF